MDEVFSSVYWEGSDRYRIRPPFVVSFSGGRTSAYLLYHIWQAWDGKLPEESFILFCNTGRERPETLDFVHEIETRWGIRVVWLEYRTLAPRGHRRPHGFAVVDYETASRKGEPFEAIVHHRGFLPNRRMRFCTGELKIRTKIRYLKSLGYKADAYRNAVSIRADEPKRAPRFLTCGEADAGSVCLPLYDAGVTEADVMAFWSRQSFDLQLKQHEGNCDLCFLKGRGKLDTILRDRPDLAQWWIDQENWARGRARMVSGETFRNDRPRYELLLAESQRPTLFCGVDDSEPCHGCTD